MPLRNFATAAPEHPRAPEAMFAMANPRAELKHAKGARMPIEDLVKAYPRSVAAESGKDWVASLK